MGQLIRCKAGTGVPDPMLTYYTYGWEYMHHFSLDIMLTYYTYGWEYMHHFLSFCSIAILHKPQETDTRFMDQIRRRRK